MFGVEMMVRSTTTGRPPRRRAALWGAGGAAVAFSAVLALAAIVGCEREVEGEPQESALLPDSEIDGFKLTQTREGEKLWILSASRALVFEEADRVELTQLRVDYFDEEGNVRSTLTAAEGLLRRRTNDMEASGNVVVVAEDGTRLVTERLTWNERTGKIESDRFVRVTQGDDVFTGVGIEADPDLKNIKVKSDFKAFVRTADGRLIEEE
jgi:LPS export ABC transporter protein LptC